jgi:hypothetical protein
VYCFEEQRFGKPDAAGRKKERLLGLDTKTAKAYERAQQWQQ